MCARNASQILPPPPCRENILEYVVAKKHIGQAEREILVSVYGYCDFNPPYRKPSASQQLLIARIAVAITSFNPPPCQTLHGYMVASSHRVKVEVGADGPTSAPPSGAAAGGRRQPRKKKTIAQVFFEVIMGLWPSLLMDLWCLLSRSAQALCRVLDSVTLFYSALLVAHPLTCFPFLVSAVLIFLN
jgi:hypothetical protein